MKLSVTQLPNTGDSRGGSFTLPPAPLAFLGQAEDIHLASILPGAVRGNHFHTRRKEVLIVLHESNWRLYWDDGADTLVNTKTFEGQGAEIVFIEPGISHAIQNTGMQPLTLVGASSITFDPRETIARKLI